MSGLAWIIHREQRLRADPFRLRALSLYLERAFSLSMRSERRWGCADHAGEPNRSSNLHVPVLSPFKARLSGYTVHCVSLGL